MSNETPKGKDAETVKDALTGGASLLDKPIGTLTDADREALTKYLGTPGRPYPMMRQVEIENSEGDSVMVKRLGNIENGENMLEITSERSYAEVVGMAYRLMPTPGMLEAFNRGLLYRRIDSERRIQFIKGDPGSGKSFMGEMIGNMTSKKGAYVVDCGGRNINDLLYEMVLDLNADSRFYKELDKRLAEGQISSLSKSILRDCLGAAVAEKDGKLIVDWDRVGEVPADGGKKLWGGKEAPTRSELVDRALKGLEKVRSIEGMEVAATNALGMTSQEGPLIKAFREGREIVLDEYNKSKMNGDDKMQGVLQFFNGEKKFHTVDNPFKTAGDASNAEFTFRREDMKPGFFVTLTGNASEDGTSTRSLSKSVYSRIDVDVIRKATVEDWQHRICQIMTGLPVSTLFRSAEFQWRKNPDEFTKKLHMWRTIGMSDEEKRNIPEHQLKLLDNWQNVLKATEKLARFYHAWEMSVDPESNLMDKPTMAKVRMEVEDVEEYKNEVSVDFRKIIQHVGDAMAIQPTIQSIENTGGYDDSDWGEAPELGKILREEPELNFGTRLVDTLLSKVASSSADRGMNHLYEHLMGLAVQFGLRAPDLKEGASAKQELVGELLNINEFKDKRPNMQFRLMQKLVADEVRAKNPKIKALDDEIITRTQLERAADALARIKPVSDRENVLALPNTDAASLRGKPFLKVKTQDSMPIAGGQKATVPAEKLVDAEAVLATLIVPKLGAANIKGLFSKGLSGTGVTSTPTDLVVDEALAIAEGQSKSGLKVTSVTAKVEKDGKAVASHMHVFHDAANERTVIIGDGISNKLQRLYKRAGINYVDRTDPRATLSARRALEDFLKGRDDEQKQAVKDAFLFRVEARAGVDVKETPLADLAVSKDVQVYLPHYLTSDEVAPSADRRRAVNSNRRMPRVVGVKAMSGKAPSFAAKPRRIKAPRL